jgi:hypothetical protein
MGSVLTDPRFGDGWTVDTSVEGRVFVRNDGHTGLLPPGHSAWYAGADLEHAPEWLDVQDVTGSATRTVHFDFIRGKASALASEHGTTWRF